MHIFGRGTPAEDRLSRSVREQVIEEAAKSGIDLIFTYVWNFSQEKGKHNIDAYKRAYETWGGEVYFVELVAPKDVRSARAADPERHRLKPHAPTSAEIAQAEQTTNFQSPSPFYYPEHYAQIDASSKQPSVIASEITRWIESFSSR
jgi:hypothetical protein